MKMSGTKHDKIMRAAFFVVFVCLIFFLPVPAQTITGSWKLTWMVVELDMAYSIIVPVTLSIEENGTISGNGGCNSFTGNYSFKKPKKIFKKPLNLEGHRQYLQEVCLFSNVHIKLF